jgi:2-furoyl-CoA dehydrogenase large subunit
VDQEFVTGDHATLTGKPIRSGADYIEMMNVNAASGTASGGPWVGRSIPRVEDPTLLSGRGRFIDDIGVRPGTLHAAILRSPHAHANIVSIDVAAAKEARGVIAVLTDEDIKELTASLVVGVKVPVECWPIAVGRVRYVGEPVAIVVAESRYLAEDAIDLIDARYEGLPAIVDPVRAMDADAALLHDGLPNNIASDRSFKYGDPDRVFTEASRTVVITIRPAIPAPRSRPMALSQNTIRANKPSTCSPIFRARSAFTRCCRAH